MRPIPQRAVSFIKSFEGVKLSAYTDIAGIATIGWGHTKGVALGQTITLAQAEAFLTADLAKVAQAIAGILKPDILAKLTDQQYAALLSFGFNLGVSGKDGIWGLINSGQFDRVPSRMLLYNKARVNGQLVKVNGLTRRRQAEAALWEEGQGEDIVLTAYHADTPPTEIEKPARKSVTLWAIVASPFIAAFNLIKGLVLQAVGWLTPDQVNTVSGAISPFADKSTIVASALSILAVVAAVVAAILALRKHNAAKA